MQTKKTKLAISDHALVRYMERVLGVDVGGVRKQILDAKSKKDIGVLGDCTYPVNNLYCVVVKDGVVVTVKPVGKMKVKKQTNNNK